MNTREAFEAWHDADTLGGPDCDMREIEAIAFAAGAAWAARECEQLVRGWSGCELAVADIRAAFPSAFEGRSNGWQSRIYEGGCGDRGGNCSEGGSVKKCIASVWRGPAFHTLCNKNAKEGGDFCGTHDPDEALRPNASITCPASRHVEMMADGLESGGYPMLADEPEHCAESMHAVVRALWDARRMADTYKTRCHALEHAVAESDKRDEKGAAATLRLIRERDEARRDAERYAFLKARYSGADFKYGDESRSIIYFDWKCPVMKNLDAAIDAAMHPPAE